MTSNIDIKYLLNYSELKEIIDFVNITYKIDLSIYSKSILKHRIELFINQYNIQGIDGIKKLLLKEKVIPNLMKIISVETTGMFRDIEMWSKLKEKFDKSYNNVDLKIWIPEVTSDDELFTLIIFLEEQGIFNYSIVATSNNPYNFNRIQKITFTQKKIDLYFQNYNNFCNRQDGLKYFETSVSGLLFKKTYLKNVEFVEHSILNEFETDKMFDFILFRNRMLYYDYSLKDTIIKNVILKLKVNGLLIIGLKETINTPIQNNLVEIDKEMKIYKRKS